MVVVGGTDLFKAPMILEVENLRVHVFCSLPVSDTIDFWETFAGVIPAVLISARILEHEVQEHA